MLCSTSILVFKKFYIQRHFHKFHAKFDTKYPVKSKIRTKKINQLKSRLNAKQNAVISHEEMSKNATIASTKISHMLAMKKKPFQDGELIKEAFVIAAESLFKGFSNKSEIMSAIQSLQLSNNTITRRIHEISADIQTQLKNRLGNM